uniref:Uncharacterized protein n=1 Tax=Octopus bimaculoides TaxID=37653 RepID=A0A0L8HXP8_OCTBM
MYCLQETNKYDFLLTSHFSFSINLYSKFIAVYMANSRLTDSTLHMGSMLLTSHSSTLNFPRDLQITE